ncbi:MAG: hypothetical protein AAF533_24680 [Acidobacteriota bacterium]
MPKFSLSQARSGEGAFLATFSHLPLSEVTTTHADLFKGNHLLIGGEGLEAEVPESAKELGTGLYLVSPEHGAALARRRLADENRATLLALVDGEPDPDVLRRAIPETLRPWDHERLNAQLYAQQGRRYVHRGLFFHDDRERERFLAAGFSKVLEEADLDLPPGDLSLVFDLQPEGTFEAVFRHRGRGDDFKLTRDFPEQGLTREWWIDRYEWKGEERRRPKGRGASLAARLVQGVATTAIFVVSLPVAALVGLSLLTSKLDDVSGTGEKLSDPA